MAKKLTEKQKLFIAAYCANPNATKAAESAGYSAKTAYSIGQENLKKPEIAEEIEKRLGKKAEKYEISGEKVLRELALMGFANMEDYIGVKDGDAYVDLSAVNRDQFAAVQEITVEEYTEGRGEDKRDIKRTKFKLADKRGSLELLGKHLKLFTEKHELKLENLESLSDEQLAVLATKLSGPESVTAPSR